MVERRSYIRGASQPPLSHETIDRALKAAAERWPEREAIVSSHQRRRLTYSQLDEQTTAIASGLRALGLEPGDRIGLWSSNRVEWALTQYAAAKAGLILVTVNSAYRVHELEYALNKVGGKALVTEARFKSSDYLAMPQELCSTMLTWQARSCVSASTTGSAFQCRYITVSAWC